MLIRRDWHRVVANRLRDGGCPDCGCKIPGRWENATAPATQPESDARTIAAKYDGLNL
jgi:hypothetical protein